MAKRTFSPAPQPRQPNVQPRRDSDRPEPKSERKVKKRPEVPMDAYREPVIEAVRNSPNAVIIGETGSGKSTRIPLFLLEAFPDARIAITQPRRVAARSVAGYVAELHGTPLGEDIGFRVRFDDQTSEKTRCNFMTDGLLLAQISRDSLLRDYDIVVVDEAHERSVNIDLLMGLLKMVQALRQQENLPELKVIATSATIEKGKFSEFFNEAPIIEAPGKLHPIDIRYATQDTRNYPAAAAQKVQDIVQKNEPGDIIIFMPGKNEIEGTIKELQKLNVPGIDILPLYATMAPEDQDRIFQKTPRRKVIVSTNIAETSVTIDGITHVIDSGLIRQTQFNAKTGIESLIIVEHAQSGCRQRAGRAGRTAPGICHRLYSEQNHTQRAAFQVPEVQRSNLDHVILRVKKLGISHLEEFPFIDPPEEEAIRGSEASLKELGALDDSGELTADGELMADLPVSPELSRMIIEARKLGCVKSVATIAAFMGDENIFFRPKDKEHEADSAHRQFEEGGSDFLKFLNIWEQWEASGFNAGWAHARFLNLRALKEIRDVRSQLLRTLKDARFPVEDQSATADHISKAVAAGMIRHLMVPLGRGAHRRVATQMGADQYIYVFPGSSTFSARPDLLIGADVKETTKVFARKCHPVNPDWLPEIAPHLLTKQNETTLLNAQTGVLERVESFLLKGSYDVAAEKRTQVFGEEATVALARNLAAGTISIPGVTSENTRVLEAYRRYHVRSSNPKSFPIEAWYAERLKGVFSVAQAQKRADQLRLSLDALISPEERASIDRVMPERIVSNGVTIPCEYSEYGGTRSVELLVDRRTAFKIDRADIPAFAGLRVTYRNDLGYSFASLSELLTDADQYRIQMAWESWREEAERSFARPRTIAIDPAKPLPTPAEYRWEPREYARDHQGKAVMAYPAVSAQGYLREYYGSEPHFDGKFELRYFSDESKAMEASRNAERIVGRMRQVEEQRMEQSKLLRPLEDLVDATSPLISYVNSVSPQALGLDYYRFQEIQTRLNEARYALTSRQNLAIHLQNLKQIQTELTNVIAETERQQGILDALKPEVDAFQERMGSLHREDAMQYGLTPSGFDQVQNDWRYLQKAFRGRDHYGEPVRPDGEGARTLFAQIKMRFSEQREISPEQKRFEELLGDRDVRYAQLLTIRGGRVISAGSPLDAQDIHEVPGVEVSVGKSGRSLMIQGNSIVFRYGGGSEGNRWRLRDGAYVFMRDAYPVFAVEADPRMPHGLRVIKEVEPMDPAQAEIEARRAMTAKSVAAPTTSHSPFAALQEKFQQKVAPAPVAERPAAPVPAPRPVEKKEEMAQMTDELRKEFLQQILDAQAYLDEVRAIPDPDKKASNAAAITKVKNQAQERRVELKRLALELESETNATSARGKVQDLTRRARKLAQDAGQVLLGREQWHPAFAERAESWKKRAFELAAAQGVTVDEAFRKKLHAGIVAKAKSKQEIADADLDGELESVVIDAL